MSRNSQEHTPTYSGDREEILIARTRRNGRKLAAVATALSVLGIGANEAKRHTIQDKLFPGNVTVANPYYNGDKTTPIAVSIHTSKELPKATLDTFISKDKSSANAEDEHRAELERTFDEAFSFVETLTPEVIDEYKSDDQKAELAEKIAEAVTRIGESVYDPDVKDGEYLYMSIFGKDVRNAVAKKGIIIKTVDHIADNRAFAVEDSEKDKTIAVEFERDRWIEAFNTPNDPLGTSAVESSTPKTSTLSEQVFRRTRQIRKEMTAKLFKRQDDIAKVDLAGFLKENPAYKEEVASVHHEPMYSEFRTLQTLLQEKSTGLNNNPASSMRGYMRTSYRLGDYRAGKDEARLSFYDPDPVEAP